MTVATVRAGVVRVTIHRHDHARRAVAVEMPVDALDAHAVAAFARAISRTPWRTRLAALQPRLPFHPRRDQE